MILGGETGDIHTLSAAILDFLLSGKSLLLDEPLVVFKRPSKSIINRRPVSVCPHALYSVGRGTHTAVGSELFFASLKREEESLRMLFSF